MESQSSALDEEYNENPNTWNDNGWDTQLVVNSHDELMSNFFSQPDALALGKTLNDLVQEDVPEELRQHKVCPGNKPSSSILMTKLDAFAVGQLLAIYEHRTVVSVTLYCFVLWYRNLVQPNYCPLGSCVYRYKVSYGVLIHSIKMGQNWGNSKLDVSELN